MKREEHAGTRAVLWFHLEQVLAVVPHCPGEHRVCRVAGEHLRQRALARAIRSHERVHFAIANREIDTLEDLVARNGDPKALDFEERPPFRHPTLPSKLIPSSRVASTANSIGSSLKTSLQNPFTIMDTASSDDSPRWRR